MGVPEELELLDPRCGRRPSEIPGIVSFAAELGVTPDAYVWAEEGTLNRVNGHFLCDECFIEVEQTSGRLVGPDGRPWVCP